jgi:hypothetical protein
VSWTGRRRAAGRARRRAPGARALRRALAGGIALSVLGLAPGHAAIPPSRVLGAVEEVVVVPPGLRLRARVDTGATLSSIDAQVLAITGAGRQRRVRFDLIGEDGRHVTVERPLVAVAEVVNGDGQSRTRPIVLLDICVGGARIPTEVTLNDRRGLEHRVLLGRRLLQGRFVVDVARRFTSPPSCSLS